MDCPRCVVPLEWKQAKVSGANCCPECQGLWLDSAVLNEARQGLESGLPQDIAAVPAATSSALSCPNDGATLNTIVHREVEVDACPQCQGLWLDKGEWEKLTGGGGAAWSATGIAAAGGAALLVGMAAVAQSTQPDESHFVTRNRGSSGFADVTCDVVEGTASGLLDGALSLIGDICGSIFD